MRLCAVLLAGGDAAPSTSVLVICVSILSDLLCSCRGNSRSSRAAQVMCRSSWTDHLNLTSELSLFLVVYIL